MHSNNSLLQTLATIEWDQPWFDHVRVIGKLISEQIAETTQTDSSLPTVLNRHTGTLQNTRGCALHFVPQQALPKNQAYETCIYETGNIPTRNNLHDFFNALIWLSFPFTKAILNQHQAQIIALHGSSRSGQRTRDLVTVFDENGLILLNYEAEAAQLPQANKDSAQAALMNIKPMRTSLTDALTQTNWPEIFLNQRAQWGTDCHPIIFGHALLEKLVTPFKAITAHSLVLPMPRSPRGVSIPPKRPQCVCSVANAQSTDFAHATTHTQINSSIDAPFVTADTLQINRAPSLIIKDSDTRLLQNVPHDIDAVLAQQLLAHVQAQQRFYPLPVMGIPGWCAANHQIDFYQDAQVFRRKPNKNANS